MLPPAITELLLFGFDAAYAGAHGGLFCSVVATAAMAATIIMLHSPHDVIDAVGVGIHPNPDDTRVFVISRHNLLRSAGKGGWERLTQGLDGYKLSALAVSPEFATDRTLFVASFGAGVFRSHDGGRTWTPCNQGIVDTHIVKLVIAADFQSSRTLLALASSGALYRSHDGGDSWEKTATPSGLEPNPKSLPTAIQDDDDYALNPVRDAGEAWKKHHYPTGISCMGFASDALVIGTSRGSLLASRDQGASWQQIAQISTKGRVTCIEIPQDTPLEGYFFVGTEFEGVFRISQGGARVESTGRVKSLTHVTALGSFYDAEERLTLLACAWEQALFVSCDLGASWIHRADGISVHRQAEEQRFGAPHFSVLAVFPGESRPQVYVGGFDGLFHSYDLERRWESVETLPLGNVISLALCYDQRAGKENPAIAVATYGAGVYFLPEGAKDWEIRNNGLTTMRVGTLRFSPNYAYDRTLFTGSEGQLLRLSGTGSWIGTPLLPTAASQSVSVRLFARIRAAEQLLSSHLSARWVNRLKKLFQMSVLRMRGRVSRYVFPTALAFSPNYPDDQTVFIGTRAHGVFCSRDGGRSVAQLWQGSGGFVFSLAVSPGYAGDGLLYASLTDGIYASHDGGTTWQRLQSAPPFRNARFVLSPGFDRDGTVFVGGLDGLWRSQDRGGHWQPCPIGPERGTTAIGGIAVSPSFATDGQVFAYRHGQGLYRSTDGGEWFERLPWPGPGEDHGFAPMTCFPDAETLFQLSPNYAEDQTLLAASYDRVYLSRDAGLNWMQLDKPSRYEASRNEIDYRGQWSAIFDDGFSAQRAYRSCCAHDETRLAFIGAGVAWIGTRGPDHGMANVLVDAALHASVDLYTPQHEHGVVLFSTVLPPGRHTITVQVQPGRNPQSRGHQVTIDAFDVAPRPL